MNNKELGKWGEKKAVNYLGKKQYKIKEINYRSPLGEIDIIAKDSQYLVFIEVKTRRSNNFGPPEAAVDFSKQQRIRKIALLYLKKNNFSEKKVRFDVISIIIDKNKGRLKHYINAF